MIPSEGVRNWLPHPGPTLIPGSWEEQGGRLCSAHTKLNIAALWPWQSRPHPALPRRAWLALPPARGLGRWSDAPPSRRRALDWQAAQWTQPKGDSLLSRGLCGPPALPAFTLGVMIVSSNQPPGGGCSCLTTPGCHQQPQSSMPPPLNALDSQLGAWGGSHGKRPCPFNLPVG